MTKLLMFFGEECIHCHEMFPLVDKLQEEEKVSVEKIEMWHNSKGKKHYDEVNVEMKCTGVPFFYNEKTKKSICGATSYENLKAWAKE